MSDRIETATKRVATALNRLEEADNELTIYFEENIDYNDEVLYQLREATGKLGYVLACLTTWDDELEAGSTEPAGLDAYFRGEKVGESRYGMYTYKTATVTSAAKPYKLKWTSAAGSINLGYYKSIEDAAVAVSGFGLDGNISKEEVLHTWSNGEPYEVDSVGSFIVEDENESED